MMFSAYVTAHLPTVVLFGRCDSTEFDAITCLSLCSVPLVPAFIVQAFEYKKLLRTLGGAGGEAALRERLRKEPGGFDVSFGDGPGKIRISADDVTEVEKAAQELAQHALTQLDERFAKVGILENCAVFDPQRFPTEESDLSDYGNAEITRLGEWYGKEHDSFARCVDPDELDREWQYAKAVMLDIRKSPAVSRQVDDLVKDKATANKETDREAEEPVEDLAIGRPLKKEERTRKNLSEKYVKLYAGFWSLVRDSRYDTHFPNLYKLVKIYITQPHSSIECERAFSAQNRIKTKLRTWIRVDRLEVLMRLSLLHRKQGVDLTKAEETLEEAAVLFDKGSGVTGRRYK